MSRENTCCSCGGNIEEHPDERFRIPLPVPESKGCISIIKTPAGEAPLEVREGWVGLALPVAWFESSNKKLFDAVSRQAAEPTAGYAVLQNTAIEHLIDFCPSAAKWWVRAGFPRTDEYFFFKVEEVMELEPVSPRY